MVRRSRRRRRQVMVIRQQVSLSLLLRGALILMMHLMIGKRVMMTRVQADTTTDGNAAADE
jgi:hypothetical protein